MFSSKKKEPGETQEDYIIQVNQNENYDHIQRLMDIFYESLDIINTTANIETANNRYDDLIRTGSELVAIDSSELDEFRQQYFDLTNEESITNMFNSAIDRYFEKQLTEINKLKTEKGKQNRRNKIATLIGNLNNIPIKSKQYAKQKLDQL